LYNETPVAGANIRDLHADAQDAAMCRAWRAAAGTENPVREVLAIGDAIADGVGQPRIAALVGAHQFVEAIAAALRREFGGQS
jgi:hypothetical protein